MHSETTGKINIRIHGDIEGLPPIASLRKLGMGAGEIDDDPSFKIEKQILTDEIQAPVFLNFAVKNISELFGYLATERVNIRICRDITGEMWFGVG